MNFKTKILLIEGGRPMEMVREHIAETIRVQEQNAVIAKELGVEEIWSNKDNGNLRGVVFKSEIHPDFTKPKGRGKPSYPKKGSEWAKRINALVGFRCQEESISTEFNIPLCLTYSRNGERCGFTHIGIPLRACGFLYIGKDGPFAMWAPDVPVYVASAIANDRGDVDEPARSFKFDIPGTRPISKNEWDLIVLQHKVNSEKEAA